jgi:hypothetical protein
MAESETPKESIRPNILFHYTSLKAFDEILKSGCLRLYGERTMNDISEGTWIESTINNSLEKHHIDKHVQSLFWAGYRMNKAATFRYLFSLSADGNSLNQWILYADKAKGVSIGFKFANCRIPEASPGQYVHKYHSFGLSPVVYENKMQGDMVDTLIFTLELAERAGDIATTRVLSEIVGQFTKMAIMFKSDSFMGEHEWRIIDNPSPMKGLVKSELKYDIRANNIREYTELPLSELFKNGKGDVTQLIVGPDSSAQVDTLKEYFADEHKLTNLDIKKSSIPFRNMSK